MNIFLRKSITAVLALSLVITSAFFMSGTDSYAASRTVYTKQLWTTLYVRKDSGSKSIRVWYNSKLSRISTTSAGSGKWSKVKYRGKTYYMWEDGKSSKVTTKRISNNYVKSGNTDYQNAVIRKAMEIRKQETRYKYSKSAKNGSKASDGYYQYDCSGFVSYVLNNALQKYCPAYNVSEGDVQLYQTTSLLNKGLKGEFNVKTVCKGKPDYSKLKAGDVLFFKERKSSQPVTHVALYLGNKRFIQSTKMYQRKPGDNIKYNGKKVSRGGVCIAPLNCDHYKKSFVAAKRFIPAGFTTADKTKTVKQYTNIYNGNKCNGSKGNQPIEQLVPGDVVTVLYTHIRGDKKTVAYVVKKNGKKGFVPYEKIK